MRPRLANETGGDGRVKLSVCLLGLVLLGAAAVISGCAHEQAFKRGTKLSRQGQYDQAIAELEEAVSLAEEAGKLDAAQRYRQKLAEVKLEAGRFYYRKAEERFAEADLGAARDLIARSIGYSPQDQTYQAFRDRVFRAIDDAGRLRAEAISLAGQGQWSAAVARMNEALTIYRTMPGGDADLRQIRDRAYNHYLSRAQDLLRQNDLAGAEAEARSALVYRDGGREAQTVLRTASNRREATDLIARGRSLLDQGDCEEALKLLERAQVLYSSHAELPALLAQARRAVCDMWIGQGRAAMDAGDYAGALRLFQNSDGLMGGYGGAGTLIADAKARLAEVHVRAAQRYLANGLPGAGVLHATAALGYQPGDSEALQLLRQCEARTRDVVRYTAAFVGIRAMPRDRVLGEMLGAAVVEHVTHMRRANIALVERTDLQMVLDEQDLSLSGLAGVRSRVPAGGLDDIDALILGQIIDSRIIDETRHTGHGESIYQDGFRPEPNPDHVTARREVDAALDRLKRTQARLADAEAELARYDHMHPGNAEGMARRRKARADVDEARQRLANAATNLGIAQVRLAGTPREIMAPNMVKYEYPIDTVTRTARIGCIIKIVDTATGELIMAETIDGRHAHSDDVVEPDHRRNVPPDPLELPDDVTMIEQAAADAIAKLKSTLSMALRGHGQRFAVQMRRAETAGDMVRAADNCMKYLFAYPVRTEQTDAMVSFLHRYLGNEACPERSQGNGLVDIRGLLRTHSRLMLDPARFPAQIEDSNGEVIIRRFNSRPSRDIRCPCTLVSIDGQPVRSIAEVQTLMTYYGHSETITITTLTRDQYTTTTLQLQPR